jgi:hypothetical protein
MTEPSYAHFIPLATVGNLSTAHLLAARLDAEGIEVRVHGEAQGPYPMTVGGFASVQLWVLNDKVEEARTILLDAEVNDALAPVDYAATTDSASGSRPSDGMSSEMKWVAAAILVILVALVIFRFAALAQRL